MKAEEHIIKMATKELTGIANDIVSTNTCNDPNNIPKKNVSLFEGDYEVAIMPGDGHCLFSAILYQLKRSIPGSHNELTMKL
jgi:hypothetical protein